MIEKISGFSYDKKEFGFTVDTIWIQAGSNLVGKTKEFFRTMIFYRDNGGKDEICYGKLSKYEYRDGLHQI